MEFLKYTLTENPMLTWVCLGVAWLLSLAWFRRSGTLRPMVCLAALPVLAGLAWLLSAVVETPREKVVATVTAMVESLKRSDGRGVLHRISNLYNNGGAKKQDIAFVVAWAVQRYDFGSLSVTRTG
ncbi:MAG: hypothetical protein QGD94_12860, partial [Planctomycetia bacterium]|nr:hypothetical protein [Planctomycetia bacterium]